MSSETSGAVLVVTLALLFGPKLLGVLLAVSDARRRRELGGVAAILRSVALDVPLSILAAPTIALTQTIELIGIARQRRAEWHAQHRRRDGLSLAAVMPRYRWHVVAGAALLLLSPLMPMAALWLAPITLGWLLSPLIVQWTASETAGRWAEGRHVFDTDAGDPHPVPLLPGAALEPETR